MDLRLFGTLEVSAQEGADRRIVPVQPKRAAVLAYLAAARPGPMHRRDTLLSLFWPESSDEHARNALSKTLHYLREALGPDALLSQGDDEVGLSREHVWCDVTAFEDAADRGDFEEAAALYRGHLMEGFHVDAAPDFEHWLHSQRKRLRLRACEMAWALSDDAEASADKAGAERRARQAVAWAPEDEGGLRRLLMLLQLHGNRAAAIQAYEDFSARLRDDYGIEPSDPTRELLDAIREGSLASAPLETGTHRAAVASTTRGRLKTSVVEVRSDAPIARSRGNRSKARVWAGTAAALAVAWIAYAAVGDPVADPAPEVGIDSDLTVIAVLPFRNVSEDPGQASVAAGMTEEISSQLAKIAAFTMISPTAVLQFLESGEPLTRIQAVLGVGTVLEGSVRQSGDSIRISARLIRAGGNDQLWGQDFDRPIADVFAVQTEVALQIAQRLGATLMPEELRRLGNPPTDNLPAYALLRQAREAPRGRQGAMQAIGLARQAIALDSTFAVAHVYIARRSMALTRPQWLDSAEVSVRRALALDAEAPGAHTVLANILENKGMLTDSRVAYLTALEIAPGDHEATMNLSNNLRLSGRYDEALFWAERGLTANPTSANAHRHVAQILVPLWDHERLRAFLDESLEKFPREEPLLRVFYAFSDIVLGRQAEGMELLRALLEEQPGIILLDVTAVAALLTGAEDALDLWEERTAITDGRDGTFQRQGRTPYGFLLRMDGQSDRGDRLLDEAWDFSYRQHEAGLENRWIPYELASISAVRGDADEAFRWLDRAYQLGGGHGPLFLLDPMFRSLRDDERFGNFVAREEADLERMRQRAFGRVGSRFRH